MADIESRKVFKHSVCPREEIWVFAYYLGMLLPLLFCLVLNGFFKCGQKVNSKEQGHGVRAALLCSPKHSWSREEIRPLILFLCILVKTVPDLLG